ncbi:DMP19 family protein [Flavobacterium sp. UBA4854]|uniref:DMP19 family protein n=1 Tax=Flavobacterium sp. UBA4854 TaxID=1946548 RepID=UPI00257958E0|nr:DUF4375 domain-containing protein [Flavobacterium sp. UBA4854]
MNENLKIKKKSLENIEYAYDYLQIILAKYYDLIKKIGDEDWTKHFIDDQHCLLSYATLYEQVQNGGFIELIWNGYYSYIFETPLIETLYKWGTPNTAKLLEKIKSDCNKLANEIENWNKSDLELFSKLYKKHPQFEAFDNEFYDDDGVLEIKNYVEKNLSNFITVE